MARRLPALGLLLVLAAGPGAAQPAGVVEAVEAAYERLDYVAAEDLARAALGDYEAHPPDALVRLHTLLGLILYARGDALEAATQFRAALTLDPSLVLDPLLVSPATIDFFEDIRVSVQREQGAEATPGAVVRYVRV